MPVSCIDDATLITQKWYGIDATVKPLVSYDDYNFYIKENHQDKSTKREFVLKIAHQRENENVLTAQNEAMKYLDQNGLGGMVPLPCPTLAGNMVTAVESTDGNSHLVRLLTYLPGKFWKDLDKHSPQSPALQENFGRFLGRMDNAMETFSHSYGQFSQAFQRHLDWDLGNAADLEPLTADITDPGHRNLVRYFLGLFNTFVVPRLSGLRKSVIHGDANDYNVLVDEEKNTVTGIIDFGDMVHTCTVFELAIALAYVIHGEEDPIAAASRVIAGYHREYPLTETEVDLLFYLMCTRLCFTVAMSASQLKREPKNRYLEISVAPALAALEKLVGIDPAAARHAFRAACDMPAVKSHQGSQQRKNLEPDEILKIRERHLGKALSVSYKKPLKIVRGYMQYLYDHRGRQFLDTVNNVCHVGHCHPKVVKAGQAQMAVLNTNTRYLHDNIIQYAEKLCATLPPSLEVCFFVCTGSEANELALRMARTHTGHSDFVVLDHAYHGNTNAVIEISPYKFNGPGGKGKAGHIHVAEMPDGFRGPYKWSDDAIGKAYATDVKRALTDSLQNGGKPAAFIHESIPGVAGQIVLPDNYLNHAYQYTRDAGGVCIADEVQIGFGRVGTHMWGFETQGVIPDIVTMGKPIGNGHPLAAVVTTREIADSFNNGMEYFNTFGGNPVSCAIGLAVLDVIEEEGLQANALAVGSHMKEGLTALMDKHRLIGDVRGTGLFLGIELVKDRETLEPAAEEASDIAEQMKDAGILVSVDGPLYNVLKIKPPLVFNKNNADQYIDSLDKILTSHKKS